MCTTFPLVTPTGNVVNYIYNVPAITFDEAVIIFLLYVVSSYCRIFYSILLFHAVLFSHLCSTVKCSLNVKKGLQVFLLCFWLFIFDYSIFLSLDTSVESNSIHFVNHGLPTYYVFITYQFYNSHLCTVQN